MTAIVILFLLLLLSSIIGICYYADKKDIQRKQVEEELRKEKEAAEIIKQERRQAELARKLEATRKLEEERHKEQKRQEELERLRKIKCNICNQSSMGLPVCGNCIARSKILMNEIPDKKINSHENIHKYRQDLFIGAINANTKIDRETNCIKLLAVVELLEKKYKERLWDDIYNFFKDLKAGTDKETLFDKYEIVKSTYSKVEETTSENQDFRDQFPKPFRCKDGDYVRSKAEREIDDFFYDNRIWHIYEQEYKHPITGRTAEPDFYLPDYNLYIEYFGSSDSDYLKKRDLKIEMYNSDKSIKFAYLTYKDDNYIYDRLKDICRKYSIPVK